MRPRIRSRVLSMAVACIFALALPLLAMPTPAQAQTSYSGSYGWQYGASPKFLGSSGSGNSTVFDIGVRSNGNLNLGCAGISLFSFVKATFNFQNIVSQMKTYMQTYLAKTLLTTLMSVPQIAAIYDSLNALGNARFDLFKQSCNIGEIRAAAKQMYIDRCKQQNPDNIAQCDINNYNSQADWIKTAVKSVTDVFSGLQNASKVVTDAMCNGQANCPMAGLIPPMRLCFKVQENQTCPIDTGMRPPAVSSANMFDSQFRTAQPVLAGINSMWSSIAKAQIPQADIRQAIDQTEAKCTATPEKCGPKTTAPAQGDINTDMLARFKSSIGCTDEGYMGINQEFVSQLSSLGHSGITLQDSPISDDVTSCVASLPGANVDAATKQTICQFMKVGLKCSLRTNGGFLNPRIRYAVMNQGGGAIEAMDQRAQSNIAAFSIKSIIKFVESELKSKIATKFATCGDIQLTNGTAGVSATDTTSDTPDEKTCATFRKSLEDMLSYLKNQETALNNIVEASKNWMGTVRDIQAPKADGGQNI